MNARSANAARLTNATEAESDANASMEPQSAPLNADIADMSDDEVEAMLLKRLQQMKQTK